MLISRLHAALFGVGLLTLLSGLCHAETVLMPRTAAEREADLKALSENTRLGQIHSSKCSYVSLVAHCPPTIPGLRP